MAEYISRDAVYTAFANAGTDVLERASEIIYIAGFSYELVIEILDNIPTVNVAPVVHGRWEETDLVELQGTTSETMRIPNMGLRCSACAHAFDKRLLWKDNYCPNCGAKMKGGIDNVIDRLEDEWGYEGMREELYDLPTADVEPVIRCKDCKHRTLSGHCKMCRHSDGSMRYALDDEFCSMGAKMDGGEDE